MEMLKQALRKTLPENRAELQRLETAGRSPASSRLYRPNGDRERARRLRQLQRKQEKATA